jgi:hypothetical protein
MKQEQTSQGQRINRAIRRINLVANRLCSDDAEAIRLALDDLVAVLNEANASAPQTTAQPDDAPAQTSE